MKIRFLTLILYLSTLSFTSGALSPVLDNPWDHPPRIIRACCMFGSKVGVVVIPFVKLTEVTSIEKIGEHHFLGHFSENNGIIYTRSGGFIDMGHMRDQADWTAYLYALMQKERALGCIRLELGYEGGQKSLSISLPSDITDDDLILLAGRMAYDISIWHEIATWFGVSTVPLVSEQFSSFSVEDGYSNLLGVHLGMAAIRSKLPYEKAMTELTGLKLNQLLVVGTERETLDAMETVRDIWWTRNALMPSNRVQIARQTTTYDSIYPRLIPVDALLVKHRESLIIPSVTSRGDSLSHIYELSVKLNYKFPANKIFPDQQVHSVTQHHFMTLVAFIENQLKNSLISDSKPPLVSFRKSRSTRNRTEGVDLQTESIRLY
jgi:hypothetical protein